MRPLFLPRKRRLAALLGDVAYALVCLASCIAIGAMAASGF
jgi:hypothetical protein